MNAATTCLTIPARLVANPSRARTSSGSTDTNTLLEAPALDPALVPVAIPPHPTRPGRPSKSYNYRRSSSAMRDSSTITCCTYHLYFCMRLTFFTIRLRRWSYGWSSWW